jgi:beta-lactamase class A
LPEGVIVAHKTCRNDKLYHEAAIVYPPQRTPYALVIMTSGLSKKQEATDMVATLSYEIYQQCSAQ